MYIKDYILRLLSLSDPSGRMFLAAVILLWVTALVIAVSVAYKFASYTGEKREKSRVMKNPVETFSMTAVIIVFFNILQSGSMMFRASDGTWLMAEVFGGILALLAAGLHIWSKMEIGKYWSNQIEILKGHSIVTSGPYAIVRHPMYSSIILWMAGMSMVFLNYGGLIITFLIFTPMMIYRANAEDKALEALDPAGFAVFKSDAYQLIPKFRGMVSLILKLTVIALLGWTLFFRQMTPDRFAVLLIAHFTAGLISYVPKIRFSYMNKSFIMLIIFVFNLFFPAAFWFYYLILVFDVYGLFFDCPCMWIYEKFHGCPCLSFIGKCAVRLKPGK